MQDFPHPLYSQIYTLLGIVLLLKIVFYLFKLYILFFLDSVYMENLFLTKNKNPKLDVFKNPKKKLIKEWIPINGDIGNWQAVYIVIFDDLSTELKDKAVPYFMKQNRHFKALCILSSQYLFDLAKDGRNQIDYILMFPNLPTEKVESIQRELDLNISKKKFYDVYMRPTIERYNFLFVNVRNGTYRKNFNTQITL